MQSKNKHALIKDALLYITIHLHISFAYATIISALYKDTGKFPNCIKKTSSCYIEYLKPSLWPYHN